MGIEGFRELLKSSRSIRRYDSSVKISREELMKLIELSRYCPSANNKQRLRFRAINDEEGCRNVFSNVIFAGSLGKGIEKAEIENMEKDGDTAYYRDEDRVHHVPKRRLGDILI